MYGIDITKLGFVYFTTSGKLYARISCDVEIGTNEYIPAPLEEDIQVDDNAGGGKDIQVDLYVGGAPSNLSKIGGGTFFVFLSTEAPNKDKTYIKNLVTDKPYNAAVYVHTSDPQNTPSDSGVITQDSDIEIK